ncbi:MAG: DKNYY domain-containing protein [Bacteroidota bacterium]
MRYQILYFILFIFIFSCGQNNSAYKHNSTIYKELSKGFYFGSDNKMYIQTATVADEGKGEGSDPVFFREVPDIDTATFENLGQEGWYAKDCKNVYIDHFMTDGRHLWLLDSADAVSFESIGYRWGKDKNYVFENGIILEGLDPDSMIILCPETTEFKQVFFSMVKDSRQVFYGYDPMAGVDALTFECICSDSTVYYRDKNWIYNEHYFPNMDEINRIKR